MDWGLGNRMSRILNPKSGRTVMLAVDHGYFLGPTSGLEKPYETVKELLPYADTLMLTRGVLRASIPPETQIPIVLRVSGGTSVLFEDLSNEELTVSMEDAVRLNVSGVAISIFVGAPHEKQTLQNMASLIDEGNALGVPVLAVTAVGKDMVREARYLALASRIAAEMGAHFVKTYYCDGFEQVAGNCPVPCVIAGGKKIPEADALHMASNAIKQGAVGVDMGRNIFQSDCPIGMIQAVRKVVHEDLDPKHAYELYETIKNDG